MHAPVDSFRHLDRIQRSFGPHDVSTVSFHTGADARSWNERLGSKGFTWGESVALTDPSDLHTAAHEAAHVIQQRAGLGSDGMPRRGPCEQHADAVADAVVAGRSAESLLNRLPAGGRPRPALQLKPSTLSWSQVDVTFNAWLRKLGDIDKALARTRQQIGPPMPADYVPPPRRAAARKAQRRQQQLEAIRSLYKEYLGDYNFQYEYYGTVIRTPSDADWASDKELLRLSRDPGFTKWITRRRQQIYRQKIEEQNAAYLEALGGPETGYTPQEARQIFGASSLRTDLGVPIYDEETGVHVGYVKHLSAQKELGGAVGTVTREYYDLDGKLVHTEAPTTVLTPAAEVFQDLARSAPVVGYAINVAEIGLGESLNLRDRGRQISPYEAADRAVSALPGGDLVRGATEAATGVSLSGGEDLQGAWEGDPRLLGSRERAGKGILTVTAGATAAIGYGQAKLGPKIGPKLRPPSGRKTWAPEDITVDQPTGALGPRSRPGTQTGSVAKGGPSKDTPQSLVKVPDVPKEPPLGSSRYFTPARQRVALAEMEAPSPKSAGAAAARKPALLPARRPQAADPDLDVEISKVQQVPPTRARRDQILKEADAAKKSARGEQAGVQAARAQVDADIQANQKLISRAERGDASAGNLDALRHKRQELLADRAKLTNYIEKLGERWEKAHHWARTADDQYIESVTAKARTRPEWKAAKQRAGGQDEVLGGDPTKLNPPDELDMEHIVPRSRMRNFLGFEKLTETQQVDLFAMATNLRAMRKRANIDRGTKRYSQWDWKKFVDPARHDEVAQIIRRLARAEIELEIEIQDLIDEWLGKKPGR